MDSSNIFKIYCVFCDTMPLSDEVIDFADINKMQMLLQIGGCFTATSLTQMFTGKMPSDLLPNGMGHRSFVPYRNKKTKKMYVPWDSEFITSRLSKNNWKIHLHNVSPNFMFHGDACTDSYKGGYEKRYEKIKKFKKDGQSGKMMDKILLRNNSKSIDWEKREFEFLHSLPYDKEDCNTFYVIEYDHFHSLYSYIKTCKEKNEKKKDIKKRSKFKIINLLKEIDFNEPNSLFWIFSDHGFPHNINHIPKANGYMSWVLIKDNILNKQIESKSKIISIQDFLPTIMEKFNYKVEIKTDGISFYRDQGKNRAYFIEDGRSKINRRESTTAIACIVSNWYENVPIHILQVAYFRVKKRFYYHLNVLDKSGFFKESVELNKNNKEYEEKLRYLKKKLKKRFNWVK